MRWNDFEGNLKDSFGNLRLDKDFSDVTLVSEDGDQLEAHKVVLSISSPFFANLLKKNRHQHPLIYMRGVKSGLLAAVVDFLYLGEANILQENLESFIDLANDLQIKSLNGDLVFPVVENEVQHMEKLKSTKEGDALKKLMKDDNLNLNHKNIIIKTENLPAGRKTENLPVDQDKLLFSEELQDLEEKVRSLMELTENMVSNGKQRAHKCKVCGKEGLGSNIKTHIENYHLEDLSVPCGICEKTFKNRAALKVHIKSHA